MKLPIKNWDNKDIRDVELVTKKIDGVQCITDDNCNTFSRAGKPLYNIPKKLLTPNSTYEIFYNNWNETISVTRSFTSEIELTNSHIYELYPNIDQRLLLPFSEFLSAEKIKEHLKDTLSIGYEGLVIRTKTLWYKVKPIITYDVKVLSIIPGKGRNLGRIGALITEYGNVGSGLTDKDRERIKVGDIIEVECMELTKDNKFRHPRFIRLREDK